MKRQILFRGMSIRGEWSEGYYTHIIRDTAFKGAKEGHYISNSVGMPFAFQVRPETVGQFSGLLDAKGTKIFEGDIISSPEFDHNLLIGYSLEKAAFVGSKTIDFSIKSIYNFLDDIVLTDDWEVIGNRFEDPEYFTSTPQS